MEDCHGPAVATLPPPVTSGKQHVVAIVGPPNSGKSTLFNRLTGLRQKVANFPGVTVEHRMGRAKLGHLREIFVVDLPGVYSLQPRTEDERVGAVGDHRCLRFAPPAAWFTPFVTPLVVSSAFFSSRPS